MVGGQRWALLRETPDGAPTLENLAARLAPADLVLVEGFKDYDFPKLEVYRAAIGKPPIWPGTRHIVAVASDTASLPDCPHPLLDLNDLAAIAGWAVAFAARSAAGRA